MYFLFTDYPIEIYQRSCQKMLWLRGVDDNAELNNRRLKVLKTFLGRWKKSYWYKKDTAVSNITAEVECSINDTAESVLLITLKTRPEISSKP